MQSGNLSESNIGFSFGAVFCFLDIENALFIMFYALVIFSAVAQISFAKEIFTGNKSHSDYNLFSFLNKDFCRQHYVNHFRIYIHVSYFKLHHFLGPAVRSQFYFVKTFEVHTFTIILKYLVNAESGELYIFVRYETYGIVSFFIGNVAEPPFRSVHLFKPMENFWGIDSAFKT